MSGASKKTLQFDFAKAVRGTLKDHPQLAKNTFFVDAKTGTCLTVSPLYKKLIEDDDKVVQAATLDMHVARQLKTSFAYNDKTEDGDDVHVLIFHSDLLPLFSPRPGAIDDAGSFYHEVAHVLEPSMKGRRGESMADSYALLRQLQETKGEMPDADYCGWRRAVHFVMTGADSHVTTFVVDKILIDQKAAHFISLTPKEMIAIAKAYAREHAPPQADVDKALADFKGVCGKAFNQKRCREIAEITLKADPKSPTFYLGRRILSGLWQAGGREINGRTIELKGAAWDVIRAKIDSRNSAPGI